MKTKVLSESSQPLLNKWQNVRHKKWGKGLVEYVTNEKRVMVIFHSGSTRLIPMSELVIVQRRKG